MIGTHDQMHIYFDKFDFRYQEIFARDLIMRLKAPEGVLNFLAKNESFSLSGDTSKGQGGDAIEEEANKAIKHYLPDGIPTFSIWQKVCRNIAMLEEVRHSLH